jgi:hypothetical protein
MLMNGTSSPLFRLRAIHATSGRWRHFGHTGNMPFRKKGKNHEGEEREGTVHGIVYVGAAQK